MTCEVAGCFELREILEEAAGISEERRRRRREPDKLLVDLLLPRIERDRRRFLAHADNVRAECRAASRSMSSGSSFPDDDCAVRSRHEEQRMMKSAEIAWLNLDRKSTRLNSSHG